jgi:hypothetical protein
MGTLRRWYARVWIWYDDHRDQIAEWTQESTLHRWH